LEVGDICTLSIGSLKKIYFTFLPVLVTGVTTTGKGTKYLVASKYGHIKGSFSRGLLHYTEQYTAETLQIYTDVEGFKRLSLQEASTELAYGSICSCKRDCSKIACCSCKASGSFCTSLGHSARGNNTICRLLEDLCCDLESDSGDE
jgi:hypothetical protein